MGDGLSIIGGILFLGLAGLSYFRCDLVWKLYSLEPKWRESNPERTEKWDAQTKRNATYFLLIGIAFIAFGFLI